MEREDGVIQLAGAVAVEIFTAQKGHISFIIPQVCKMYHHFCAGTPTTHGHIKLATATVSGGNNISCIFNQVLKCHLTIGLLADVFDSRTLVD